MECKGIIRFVLLSWISMSLLACAESKLAVHVAKKITQGTANKPDLSSQKGTYKIGKPYKIKGVWYYPHEDAQYDRTGIASWYGKLFHGRRTANGEIYDMNALTAAHKTLPMPVRVQVTNLENGRSLELKINDRGPFVNGRIIDVSRRAAQLLGFFNKGTAKVRVTLINSTDNRVIAKRMPTPEEQKNALPALPRGDVTAQTLEPPPGLKQAKQLKKKKTSVRIATATPHRVTPENVGQVTQRPVGPSSIFIQAGAFVLAKNANKLRARLAYIGPSKITNVFIKGQEMFRVRIGPLSSVEAADRYFQQILDGGVTNAQIIVD